MIKKLLGLMFLIFAAMALFPPSVAEASYYVIEDAKKIFTPKTYEYEESFYSFVHPDGTVDYFRTPEEMFMNEEGYLFVADTGNNRIVKLDQKGNLIGCFYSEESPFDGPRGIWADERGNMYIADTGNYRIVHLDHNGTFIEEFTKPNSSLLESNFLFDVTKIALSKTGYIYVVKGESIMMIDANNNFRGYLGQVEISFKLVDVLIRIFATERQQSLAGKRYAVPYTNIFVDGEGMIYATSNDKDHGEIKKLNTIGKNIYRNYDDETKSFKFGERRDDRDSEEILPKFISVTVDKNGVVTALDAARNKIYQYDMLGSPITVFGGEGKNEGFFSAPVSVVVAEDGTIFVLDRSKNNIQSFKPTRFLLEVHEASRLYSNGYYEEARELYDSVVKQFSGYPLAIMGVSNSMYKKQDWTGAMDGYFNANDRKSYTRAFDEYRYEIFRDYFFFVLLGAVLAGFVIVQIFIRTRKIGAKTLDKLYFNKTKISFFTQVKMSLGVVFSPRVTFETIKSNRGNLNLLAATAIYAAAFLARVFNIAFLHFPFRAIEAVGATDAWYLKVRRLLLYYPWYTLKTVDTNVGLELGKLMLPAMTWVIASYLISSILEGESRLDEIYVATSFCYIPYIIICIPLTIFSNIMAGNEEGLFILIGCLTWLWVLMMICYSFKVLNDYKPMKLIVGTALSSVSIILVWLVCMLGYVSTTRIYQFFEGLLLEIRVYWFM